MSKNIIIRDLTEDQQQKLEALKEHFGEKTSSKIVLLLLDKYLENELVIKKLRAQNLEKSRKQRAYESFFKNVKSEIADTNLELNEDSHDDY